jgi:hypothetical protein
MNFARSALFWFCELLVFGLLLLHLLTCVCASPSELLEGDLLSPISVRYFPLQPPAQNNVFFGWMIPAGAALLHLHIAACRQMDTSWLRFVLH